MIKHHFLPKVCFETKISERKIIFRKKVTFETSFLPRIYFGKTIFHVENNFADQSIIFA